MQDGEGIGWEMEWQFVEGRKEVKEKAECVCVLQLQMTSPSLFPSFPLSLLSISSFHPIVAFLHLLSLLPSLLSSLLLTLPNLTFYIHFSFLTNLSSLPVSLSSSLPSYDPLTFPLPLLPKKPTIYTNSYFSSRAVAGEDTAPYTTTSSLLSQLPPNNQATVTAPHPLSTSHGAHPYLPTYLSR